MQQSEVKLNHCYWATVSGQRVQVQVLDWDERAGYEVLNLETNRILYFKTAAKLSHTQEKPGLWE